MVYQLPAGGAVKAAPGEFVRCDCFGRFLRLEGRMAHGLGLAYRAMSDGTLRRIIF